MNPAPPVTTARIRSEPARVRGRRRGGGVGGGGAASSIAGRGGRHQQRDPRQRAEHDVEPDDLGGQLERVLGRADEALAGEQDADGGHRVLRHGVLAAPAHEEPHADAGQPEERRHRRVPVDRPVERVRALPRDPLDHVARSLAAGVRAGGGGDRATGQRGEPWQQQQPHRPRAQPIGARRPLTGLEGRAPHERDAGHQQQHREQEVHDHPARGQVVDHREAAPHGLRGDAERQQRDEQQQVAPERAAPPRHLTAAGTGSPRRSSSHGCRTRSARACAARE